MSKPETSNSLTPNIAKGGIIMAASIFLSRILGLVREAVITGQFGNSTLTDAYFAAFSIPDLLFYLVAGGALSSAFIPVFSEYLHTDREDEAWHIFSVVLTLMSIIVAIFIAVAMVFTPLLIQITAPQTDPTKAAEFYPMAVMMARIVLPAQFAFFIGGILFGTLYSRNIFTVPGLGPNIYNIGIIFGALVLSQFMLVPTAGMSWGATIGAFIGNLLIPLIAMRSIGLKYKFSLDTKHPGVRKVFRLMAPVVFGLSLPGVFALFLVAFSSWGYGEESGFISSFRQANTLMQAPLGVFGQSMALAVFPALSQFFAQKNMDMFRDQLIKTLRSVIYLTVPVSFILIFASSDVIRLVYQHGQFTAADTARMAPLLTAFAIGVPFWCLQPILMRAFFAIQNTLRPILLGTLATAIFLAISFAVVTTDQAPYALALGGSVAAIALVILLIKSIAKEVPGLNTAPLFKTAVKASVAAIPSTAVFWGIFRLSEQFPTLDNKYAALALGLFFGLVSLWVYYFITKFFRMPESAYLDRVANRINKKSKTEPN
ncbi:murein biosynthesis integral membrane protein MurJ [Armatimonadetes bacterium Uphvl-Ar1]|nr:murein biosynthesis integral membrane protein MurJ [Armatimonadetes bacterium Uphvl-Ar1]